MGLIAFKTAVEAEFGAPKSVDSNGNILNSDWSPTAAQRARVQELAAQHLGSPDVPAERPWALNAADRLQQLEANIDAASTVAALRAAVKDLIIFQRRILARLYARELQ